jgi:hypothetical protein
MPFAYWLSAIEDRHHPEHKKILNRSISFFTSSQFIKMLGEKTFIESWKMIREDTDTEDDMTRQGQIILDAVWAMLVTGFAFSQKAFHIKKPLSKQMKVTYVDISSRAKKTIHQVARDTNRPYNKVFVDAIRLQTLGLIKATPSVENGKRVTFLSAI